MIPMFTVSQSLYIFMENLNNLKISANKDWNVMEKESAGKENEKLWFTVNVKTGGSKTRLKTICANTAKNS